MDYSYSHEERLFTTNSEATIVQTDGVSAVTDQKNSTSTISHFNATLVDRDTRSGTQAPYSSKKADEKDGMSPPISHESIREHISAKTDVDYPEVHKFQDLKNQFFTIGKFFLSRINIWNILSKVIIKWNYKKIVVFMRFLSNFINWIGAS